MNPDEIRRQITNAAKKQGLNPDDLLKLAGDNGLKFTHKVDRWLDQFITEDSQMLALKDEIRRVSRKSMNVLLIGETGTGKEILAHALHGDRTGEFLGVNCASIHNELLESELFGAVKGSYTGCYQDRMGNFEYCKDGTIFLDEIGDMPRFLQSKLLRVIENRELRRLGSNSTIHINCRIIAATNRADIRNNDVVFRQDLYYRLAAIELFTKPLRERRADIPLIARFYDPLGKVDKAIFEYWKADSMTFPLLGNVRELKNLMEKQLLLLED